MDDEFSDDGFDDLNDQILQELENKAIQLTQAPAPSFAHHNEFAVNEYSLDDDDLDDTVVIDENAQQPPQPAVDTGFQPPASRVIPSLAGQQQQWNQQQTQHPRPTYAPPLVRNTRPCHDLLPPTCPSIVASPAAPAVAIPHHAAAVAGKPNEVIGALQARLSALEAELTAAKGEAAIMRSKFDKANLTHDVEVARLKKQTAEQVAKQERMVEAAAAAERKATTELQFARQDLKEELGRSKNRKKDGASTPKKTKSWGLADGFDGMEIMASPSKGQAQKKRDAAAAAIPPVERTPTKGKRKRPAVDSPSFALETHSEDTDVFDIVRTAEDKVVETKIGADVLPFDFLKLVLDHSPLHDQPLTFDLFARFAFPSNPSQTFASIIFHKLPQMGIPQNPMQLLVDFTELIVDMWQQCLSEKYHAPIYYLAALVTFSLQLNTVAVAPHIISSLVPVCTTTCRLVALPRFNSEDGDISEHADAVVRQLYSDIDVTQSLSLLYISALGCLWPASDDSDVPASLEHTPQVQFWKAIELEFVMMMLSPKHPEQDWFGMLSLLWTSVTPCSIGPIPNPVTSTTHFANGRDQLETPAFVAGGIIDRVSAYLSVLPRWVVPRSVREVEVRLAVLKTLVVFATSPFGALHLANSSVAIPRLVTVLCWAIDRLYDADLPPMTRHVPSQDVNTRSKAVTNGTKTIVAVNAGKDANQMDLDQPDQPDQPDAGPPEHVSGLSGEEEETEEEDVSTLLCDLIAQTTQLLHKLITDPETGEVAKIAPKLAASHGAAQRYLLTLARLSFAEDDLVLEAGIDADTVELAHDLLELAVTPDEGEGVGEVFGV
ncbi:hypothetical protein B0T17DRAFT_509356 [Bombardia bombarda]|uniref:DNA repair protein Rad26 n=1 Tax=Bombardia bombarda TaxID=252184 RepID=A0AA40C1Y7_9PEZI|nr:hypothetical protein B0T17DRAFT_509356 [Bombardia bombarda]